MATPLQPQGACNSCDTAPNYDYFHDMPPTPDLQPNCGLEVSGLSENPDPWVGQTQNREKAAKCALEHPERFLFVQGYPQVCRAFLHYPVTGGLLEKRSCGPER